MNKYLQLFRLLNCILALVGLLVATFMAAGTSIIDNLFDLVVPCFVVFLFVAGGNSLNDYIDAEIDKVSHPERPIPSGRMERKTAKTLGLVLLLGSVVVSFFTFNVECIAITVVAGALMVAYELYLKQRGFVGNLTIAVLTALVFLFGGAVVNKVEANLIVAVMVFFVSVGREIAKDIEDMGGDEGRFTLPMKIGVKNAAIVSCILYIIGPVLSVLPIIWQTYNVLYYLVILADLLFVVSAISVFSDAHKSQSFAKKGMMVALIVFILAVIQF